MTNIDRLVRLYIDIQNCHVCPEMNREKSLRLVKAVNTKSDVFIISRALAADQLRKSGVNFFKADGEPGNTGKNLERFLNNFQRSIFPQQQVTISSNVIIPKCRSGYISIYNTDIAQCYPGKRKSGKGDRSPHIDELQSCVNSGFITSEIEFIRPKLLLLMGKESRNTFFNCVLKKTYPQSLTEHIQSIVQNGRIPEFPLVGLSFHVLPIQHASGVNPRFRNMLNDTKLIKLIKEVLE